MLTLSVTFFAGLIVAAPASAAHSSRDADERARVGTTNVYEFDGDDLEGRVLTAEGTAIGQRRGPGFASLIRLRRSFLDRLHAHAQDM